MTTQSRSVSARTVIGNISLDGRVTGPGGEYDMGWIVPHAITDAARDRAFSKWLNSVEKIVFSSTLKEANWENSRIVDTDPATVIEELRQQPGGDIIVLASGSVIKSLLRAGALDRLSITLCPEVAGGGAACLRMACLHRPGLCVKAQSLRAAPCACSTTESVTGNRYGR